MVWTNLRLSAQVAAAVLIPVLVSFRLLAPAPLPDTAHLPEPIAPALHPADPSQLAEQPHVAIPTEEPLRAPEATEATPTEPPEAPQAEAETQAAPETRQTEQSEQSHQSAERPAPQPEAAPEGPRAEQHRPGPVGETPRDVYRVEAAAGGQREARGAEGKESDPMWAVWVEQRARGCWAWCSSGEGRAQCLAWGIAATLALPNVVFVALRCCGGRGTKRAGLQSLAKPAGHTRTPSNTPKKTQPAHTPSSSGKKPSVKPSTSGTPPRSSNM
eukprot:m51a1_g5354 hypothetical protein (272) ;mRNA; r:475399-476447